MTVCAGDWAGLPRAACGRAVNSAEQPGEGMGTGPPTIDSTALLGGGRELVILHGKDRYRLLLTAQNKLILTK